MRKRPMIVLLALAAAAVAAPAAWAATATDVKSILANPARDQVVEVAGTIADHIEGNEYVLRDATGQIRIDAGPPWHRLVELRVGERVTVTGEVDLGPPRGTPGPATGDRKPEIDVQKIVRGNGTTVTVRPTAGPPPWAGGPPWARATGNGKGGPPFKRP